MDDLPAELRAALDRAIEPCSTAELARIAERQSDVYRNRAPSSYAAALISSDEEALAYAAWRMPATFGAVARALAATLERVPDFAPSSQLDLGSGPGTAIWAAWARLGSIELAIGLEQSEAFRRLANSLVENTAPSNHEPDEAAHDTPPCARWHDAHLVSPADWPMEPFAARRFDLVTLCYVTGELAPDARARVLARAWDHCDGLLLIVEPGTTAGHQRLMKMREAMIAAGGHVIAPCPHAAPCPLGEGDWCHFAVRVARSRVHRRVKGADLGYEDEKYAYLAVSREPPEKPAEARILRPPKVHKASADFPVCTAEGLENVSVRRRDKIRYRLARKLRSGEVWPDA